MKKLSLVISGFALLSLTQCAGPRPVYYKPRYEGPPYATANSGDRIFGDPFFRHPVLRCLAASPMWCDWRAYEYEGGY